MSGHEFKYLPLGSTDYVGASAHYLRLGDWGILLDAGLDPHSQEGFRLPDYELIKDQPVNAIIISHAHLDHLGSLPVAIRYFPQARLYMTPATAALSEVMLFHYLRVQERKAGLDREKYQPLYSDQEVENLLFLFQSFEYQFPFRIHSFQESKIVITFWDAGHILGSAGVQIHWYGKNFFYTGNTRKSSQFILKGARYPSRVDILLTECTYGNNAEASHIRKQDEIKRFTKFLNRYLNFGGTVLIPVFALGRTQEIMVLLHRLITSRKIPPVPIYLTGMGIKINRIYDRLLHKIYPAYLPRLLKTITYNTLYSRRFRKPSVILATSGMMMPNTISYEIASDFLSERRNGIALVGWADPETPGGYLREKNRDRIRELFNADNVVCGLDTFYFSAHSNREELLQMIGQMKPTTTLLCHGEPSALHWMKSGIMEGKLSQRTLIPVQGKWIDLD
jgi:cleavage and polyadenylation specificity factor subunit 3